MAPDPLAQRLRRRPGRGQSRGKAPLPVDDGRQSAGVHLKQRSGGPCAHLRRPPHCGTAQARFHPRRRQHCPPCARGEEGPKLVRVEPVPREDHREERAPEAGRERDGAGLLRLLRGRGRVRVDQYARSRRGPRDPEARQARVRGAASGKGRAQRDVARTRVPGARGRARPERL